MIKLDLQSIGTSLELHGRINHILKMGIVTRDTFLAPCGTLLILVTFWHQQELKKCYNAFVSI